MDHRTMPRIGPDALHTGLDGPYSTQIYSELPFSSLQPEFKAEERSGSNNYIILQSDQGEVNPNLARSKESKI